MYGYECFFLSDNKINDHILLLHSTPPAKVPKLQLAVEQSLTGGHWNAPEKIPHVQRQRSSHSKMVGGASSQQNQTQYPPVG